MALNDSMSRFATRPLLGGKRTSLMRWLISANAPNRTFHRSRHHVGICPSCALTDSPPRRATRHRHPLALEAMFPPVAPKFVGTRLHRAYTAHEQLGGTSLRTY